MTDLIYKYSTTFTEQFKAIGFAQMKKEQIKNQIDDFLAIHHSKYSQNDFEFLEEISELIIRARRALTYSIPLRILRKQNRAKI